MAEGQEDVEQFLWDFERELAHLGGEERRELVKEAENRLHEVATALAEADDADRVRWFHYVQATAEIGPPERLAAELAGEPLPDRQDRHVKLWVAAGLIVVGVAAIVAFAWFTTGSLEPAGEWGGQAQNVTDRRQFTFDVDGEAESVFLSVSFVPTGGHAKITVLDGDANLVYQQDATTRRHVQTSEFLNGSPGTWTIVVDFEEYTGSWSLEAQQEVD